MILVLGNGLQKNIIMDNETYIPMQDVINRINRQDEYVKNLKLTIQQLLKAKQKYKAESERWMDKFYTQYPKSKLEI